MDLLDIIHADTFRGHVTINVFDLKFEWNVEGLKDGGAPSQPQMKPHVLLVGSRPINDELEPVTVENREKNWTVDLQIEKEINIFNRTLYLPP